MPKLDADDSGVPYLQVANAIRDDIAAGRYRPGEKLPTGKALAETYGVAINTVRSALDLLRQEKLVATRHGQGSYVRSAVDADSEVAEDSPGLTAIFGQLAEINRKLTSIENRLDDLAR